MTDAEIAASKEARYWQSALISTLVKSGTPSRISTPVYLVSEWWVYDYSIHQYITRRSLRPRRAAPRRRVR